MNEENIPGIIGFFPYTYLHWLDFNDNTNSIRMSSWSLVKSLIYGFPLYYPTSIWRNIRPSFFRIFQMASTYSKLQIYLFEFTGDPRIMKFCIDIEHLSGNFGGDLVNIINKVIMVENYLLSLQPKAVCQNHIKVDCLKQIYYELCVNRTVVHWNILT